MRVNFIAVVATLVLALACTGKEQRASAVVENMAQALRNEAADDFSKPPEAHSDEIETGTGRFDTKFSEGTVTSKDGVTTRPFHLVIRNRAAEPRRFQSTIRYLDHDGHAVRVKSLPETVVAPYTEKEVAGVLAIPDKVASRIVSAKLEVIGLRWDEAVQPEDDGANPR